MDPELVVAKVRELARSGHRRFLDPQYTELLKVARGVFYHAFGKITIFPWFELGAMQCPVDYMAYMECVLLKRPRVIIETGTASGCGALFWAEMLRRIHGDENWKVITIEVDHRQLSAPISKERNIISLIGSSVNSDIIRTVKSVLLNAPGPVMVTLDSDHSAEHVAREMALYWELVSPGQYLLVQDTFFGLYWGGNLDGAQQKDFMEGKPGATPFDYIGCPLAAVEAFLEFGPPFKIDLHPQRWVMTQCPNGFLLRED